VGQSSWSVIRIRLPKMFFSNACRLVSLTVQVNRRSAGLCPVSSQSMTECTQGLWVIFSISVLSWSQVRRVFPRANVAARSSRCRPTLARVVSVKDRAWSVEPRPGYR